MKEAAKSGVTIGSSEANRRRPSDRGNPGLEGRTLGISSSDAFALKRIEQN
jgi:hypothetical protein